MFSKPAFMLTKDKSQAVTEQGSKFGSRFSINTFFLTLSDLPPQLTLAVEHHHRRIQTELVNVAVLCRYL